MGYKTKRKKTEYEARTKRKKDKQSPKKTKIK